MPKTRHCLKSLQLRFKCLTKLEIRVIGYNHVNPTVTLTTITLSAVQKWVCVSACVFVHYRANITNHWWEQHFLDVLLQVHLQVSDPSLKATSFQLEYSVKNINLTSEGTMSCCLFQSDFNIVTTMCAVMATLLHRIMQVNQQTIKHKM